MNDAAREESDIEDRRRAHSHEVSGVPAVEVVDGGVIVKDRRIHQVMAHSATLSEDRHEQQGSRVVTSGRRGSSARSMRGPAVVDAASKRRGCPGVEGAT